MQRYAALALAGALVLACSGHVRPARAHIDPSRREEVVARARRELSVQGCAIAEASAATGVVRTAWRERRDRVPCGSSRCPYRDRVWVRIAPDATVSVQLERQIKMSGVLPDPSASAWAVPPAKSSSALEGVEEKQDELLEAIVE
jgi:hypothetical protein